MMPSGKVNKKKNINAKFLSPPMCAHTHQLLMAVLAMLRSELPLDRWTNGDTTGSRLIEWQIVDPLAM
jgi:hypothetical protein